MYFVSIAVYAYIYHCGQMVVKQMLAYINLHSNVSVIYGVSHSASNLPPNLTTLLVGGRWRRRDEAKASFSPDQRGFYLQNETLN